VIDLGDRYLVAKSDPITFATEEIGWYLVQVNANDLASTGAVPRWLLVTLLLPEGSATPELAERIFAQIDEACRALHVAVIGGHTEVTHDLDRPIAVGHMLGEVRRDGWVASSGAMIGDDILQVRGIAIEGSALIALEKADDLRQRGYDQEWAARAQSLLHAPRISVVREALLAVDTVKVHAMHDPTEGGLATGLHELADAACAGLCIDERCVVVLPECARLCSEYGLDPLGLIASGARLVTVPPDETRALMAAYRASGVPSAVIGCITKAAAGRWLVAESGARPLPRFDQDEVARVL